MSDAPPPLPPDPARAAPPPLPPDPAGVTPPAGPPPPPERALFHVTEETRTYPCGQCGDQLVFDIARQRLGCPSCGFSAEIDVDHLPPPAERDLRTAIVELRAQEVAHQAQRGPQVAGEKEVVCQSCGGHTTFTGTLTATRCPYCATPIQRDDVHAAPTRMSVDGVVPFRVDEQVARDKVEAWVNGRWFAPSEFKKYKQTGSFTSVYAAYFTYDADTSTAYRGERGDTYTVTVGSGDDQRTETRVRWSARSGTVHDAFDDVCVLANDGFHPRHVAALEPWPTATAEPFSPQFVAGHLCRTYDRDAEQCFGEARQRMDDQITGTVRRDIGGDQQRIHSKQTTFHSLTFKHLLLPIWLLTVIYEGKPFQVFINGVTGEVQGQRPWSKVKVAAAVVAALVAVIVVLVIWRAAGGS